MQILSKIIPITNAITAVQTVQLSASYLGFTVNIKPDKDYTSADSMTLLFEVSTSPGFVSPITIVISQYEDANNVLRLNNFFLQYFNPCPSDVFYVNCQFVSESAAAMSVNFEVIASDGYIFNSAIETQ
jgi:hypothetical protein